MLTQENLTQEKTGLLWLIWWEDVCINRTDKKEWTEI